MKKTTRLLSLIFAILQSMLLCLPAHALNFGAYESLENTFNDALHHDEETIFAATTYANECVNSLEYLYLYEAILLDSEQPNSLFIDLDPASIMFGLPLNTYLYHEGSLSSTEVIYIPIFYQEVLIAFAHVMYDNDTLVGVELTDDLVFELRGFVNSDVSLIFSSPDAYLYNNSQISFLKTYANTIGGSDNSARSYSSPDLSELIPVNDSVSTRNLAGTLPFNSFSEQYHSTVDNYANIPSVISSVPLSMHLNCTTVTQNGYNICWAAAVATIGLELTGISCTAEYISDYIYGNYVPGNTEIARFALSDIYRIEGTCLYYTPYFSKIKTEIAIEGHPIYVRVSGDVYELNHALVIDGYADYTSSSYYDGMLSICDPNYPTHKSIFFVMDQVYPYTVGGGTRYIDEHIIITS